jgi:hypothetical protein
VCIIKGEVDVMATGQLRVFGSDVVLLIIQNVMGAGLPG